MAKLFMKGALNYFFQTFFIRSHVNWVIKYYSMILSREGGLCEDHLLLIWYILCNNKIEHNKKQGGSESRDKVSYKIDLTA